MIIHAFFKSTLFLSRGSLISQSGGGQDSRFYGGSFGSSVSYVYLLVRCFSLSGFPFVVGFYSKDFIISYLSGFYGGACFLVFLLGCAITVGYSFRLLYLSFLSSFKLFPQTFLFESKFFVFPVFFLFSFCVGVGGILRWFFLSGFSVFLRSFDFLWGLFLIFAGVFIYFSLKLSFFFLCFFGSISFLRWFSSGGISFSFGKMVHFRGESSWMEVLGGMGFFSFLSYFSNFFSVLSGFGLKSVMILAFSLRFIFYMCAFSCLALALKGLDFFAFYV